MDYEKSIPECLRILVEKGIMAKEESDRILSELTESEDERIRKTLLYYHQNAPEQYTCGGLTNAEVVAWLEKQKEQEVITDSQKFEEGYKAGKHDGFLEGYNKAMESHNNSVAYHQDWPHKMPEIPTYTTTSDSSNQPELKVRQKEQKPAEWSEEDEKMRKRAICACNFTIKRTMSENHYGEARDWLKSLPIGFITNPNYNSDMVELLVSELQTIANDNGVPKQYDAEIAWLKSLRPQPHWKPSEE